MDDFLCEVALLRLKPVAWQILVYMLGRRHVEPWVSLGVFERSADALWRARVDLQKRGWIEPVPDTKLWRLTAGLRVRLDGNASVTVPSLPKPPAELIAGQRPSFSPDAAAPKTEVQRSFSPPKPAAPAAPPSFSPVPTPPVNEPAEPFLRRPREMQLAALSLWRRSMLRQDLLQLAVARVQSATFVHFDLGDALQTAERWASQLDSADFWQGAQARK